MICPKCGSENVNVTLEQVSGKTRTRNTGCLYFAPPGCGS